MASLKITEVEVTDYMGIAHKSFPVGPQGIELVGKMGAGKSSLKNAILACLGGKGIKTEYIRNGADKATILVKMDGATAKLTMRRGKDGGKGSNDLKVDGLGLGEPRARLNRVFSGLDPLAFFLADEAERTRMILSSMPAEVTADEMGNWTSGEWEGSCDGHGLAVIAAARKKFFSDRTDAKKKAAKSLETAATKKATADSLEAAAPKDAVTEETATAELAAAKAAIVALSNRKQQAEEQEIRSAGTRDQIAGLRAEAQGKEDASQNGPTPEDLTIAEHRVGEAQKIVDGLRAQLKTAEGALEVAKAKRADLVASDKQAHDRERESVRLRGQAGQLEKSLQSVSIACPTGEEIEAATNAALTAEQRVSDARAATCATKAREAAAAAESEASLDAKAVGYLDGIIENLTTVAPAALAARSEMIPGVAITEDGITMDGKRLNLLSGGESMFFAVQLSKRANPQGKLLTVDELGRLDPDSRLEFVKLCVADDWQLIGTRAERGELVVEQIEVE